MRPDPWTIGLIDHSQAILCIILAQVVWWDLIDGQYTSLTVQHIRQNSMCGWISQFTRRKQTMNSTREFGDHHVNRILGSDPWILSYWKFLGSVWRICPLQMITILELCKNSTKFIQSNGLFCFHSIFLPYCFCLGQTFLNESGSCKNKIHQLLLVVQGALPLQME